MRAKKEELRIVVESYSHDNTSIIISASPGVIEELQYSIDTFSSKRQIGIAIMKEYMYYRMNAKAFLAIQSIIADVIQ